MNTNQDYNKCRNNLKKALDNWATINKSNFEISFVEGIFLASLTGSPIIDKFSIWLLAGTGATAALMIANLDKLVPLLGANILKISMYVLLLSALFGFMAKIKSIACQITQAVHKDMINRVIPVYDIYETDINKINEMAIQHNLKKTQNDFDLNKIIVEVCKAYPRVLHGYIKKTFLSGVEDRLKGSRKAVRNQFWQGLFTLSQIATFCIYILVVVLNIKAS
jgi:hypothetical protein